MREEKVHIYLFWLAEPHKIEYSILIEEAFEKEKSKTLSFPEK